MRDLSRWSIGLALLLAACADAPVADLEADQHGDEGLFPPPNDDIAVPPSESGSEDDEGGVQDAGRSDAGKGDAGRADAGAPPAPSRAPSPVPGYRVTYPYGVKNSRYAAGYHTGEDYASPVGTPAVAVRPGIVRWSNDAGGAYGSWIGIEADNGRTYVYCHLSARAVAVGSKVLAGQRVGRVGATGNVTGPHLHFEDHPVGRFVYAQVRKPTW
jgi:murein DD-endopeptidase MepM/ murein hydrolase activator NlpD